MEHLQTVTTPTPNKTSMLLNDELFGVEPIVMGTKQRSTSVCTNNIMNDLYFVMYSHLVEVRLAAQSWLLYDLHK